MVRLGLLLPWAIAQEATMSLAYRVLPEQRRAMLKQLLETGRGVRAIEAHSGLCALIASEARSPHAPTVQFDALWISSLTSSAIQGLPDIELYLLERRIGLIEEVCQVSGLPLIVDGDTGGDAANLCYLIARLEGMGVSALVIEDKQHPKRNSLCRNAEHVLEDPERFAKKIAHGIAARLTNDFLLFARVESLIAGRTVDDALTRASMYLDAGASGVMIHAKDSEPDRVIEFLQRLRARGYQQPVICVPTTYNRVLASVLYEQGASIVIYANQLLKGPRTTRCVRFARIC
ncbi:isocitrate lyase/phosphoenolpyruvate mutase family protein [Pseudomonas tolaasii]